MKITYLPIFTEDDEGPVSCFADNVGIEVYNKKNIVVFRECTITKAANYDIFILCVNVSAYGNRNGSRGVSTDDPLSNYQNLKLAGLHHFYEPQYTPKRLSAKFADPSGNRRLLPEIRNYNNLI